VEHRLHRYQYVVNNADPLTGLQPILTSTIANRWLGERVTAIQWGGQLIGLLYWLIRHQAATLVASLFYLVPAVTSLMAFVLFDERLDAVAIAGMIACAAAVLLVNRNAPGKS